MVVVEAVELDLDALADLHLARLDADQLRDQITSRRIELYARQLLERRPSPLAPVTWSSAAAESAGAWRNWQPPRT